MLNNSTHYSYCFQYWNLCSMALNKSNTNPDFGLTSVYFNFGKIKMKMKKHLIKITVMSQQGIEPRGAAWKATMLPLHH